MVENAVTGAGSGAATFEFLRREGERWQAWRTAVEDATRTFVALSGDGQRARGRMKDLARESKIFTSLAAESERSMARLLCLRDVPAVAAKMSLTFTGLDAEPGEHATALGESRIERALEALLTHGKRLYSKTSRGECNGLPT